MGVAPLLLVADGRGVVVVVVRIAADGAARGEGS